MMKHIRKPAMQEPRWKCLAARRQPGRMILRLPASIICCASHAGQEPICSSNWLRAVKKLSLKLPPPRTQQPLSSIRTRNLIRPDHA